MSRANFPPAAPSRSSAATHHPIDGRSGAGDFSGDGMRTWNVSYEVYSFVFAESFGFSKQIVAPSADEAIAMAMRSNPLGERFSVEEV